MKAQSEYTITIQRREHSSEDILAATFWVASATIEGCDVTLKSHSPRLIFDAFNRLLVPGEE